MEQLSKKQQDTVRKAETYLQKQAEALSDALLWSSNIRRRTLDAALKGMGKQTGELLAMGKPEASALVEKINLWCNAVEPRFELFQKLRAEPLSFVTPPVADEYMLRLKGMPTKLLSQVLIHIAGECLKGIDGEYADEAAARFFQASSCKPSQSVNAALLMAAAVEADKVDEVLALKTTALFQQQLVGMWYDRVFRQKQVDKFRAMVSQLHG